MDVLDTLSNEHGLIRRFLEELARAEDELENGQVPPGEFFEKAVDFARTFADRYHHYKEEVLMFVRVAHRKPGELGGQLEVLRRQHDMSRSLVDQIAGRLAAYKTGDREAGATLRELLGAYRSLLTRHLQIEDRVLFPTARAALTAEDMAELHLEFESDRSRAGERTFEQAHKLLVDMSSLLADG